MRALIRGGDANSRIYGKVHKTYFLPLNQNFIMLVFLHCSKLKIHYASFSLLFWKLKVRPVSRKFNNQDEEEPFFVKQSASCFWFSPSHILDLLFFDHLFDAAQFYSRTLF